MHPALWHPLRIAFPRPICHQGLKGMTSLAEGAEVKAKKSVTEWVAGDRLAAKVDHKRSKGTLQVSLGDLATVTGTYMRPDGRGVYIRFDTDRKKTNVGTAAIPETEELYELVDDLIPEQARVKAFTCEEPVTFREATAVDDSMGARFSNRIWHFPKGIRVGNAAFMYAAKHSGEHYPDHDEIIAGEIADVKGDSVAVCWTKHVHCCQQDLRVNWISVGPYEKLASYDFGRFNLSWTGLEGFSPGVNDLTPKDAIVTAMKTIKCFHSDFPLNVCVSADEGWEALASIASLQTFVATIESIDAGVVNLVTMGGDSMSVPAEAGGRVRTVAEKIREARNQPGLTIKLLMGSMELSDDDVLVQDDAPMPQELCACDDPRRGIEPPDAGAAAVSRDKALIHQDAGEPAPAED